jgi:hypothetical protein
MKNKLFWLITLIVFATLSGCGGGGSSGGGSSDSGTSGTSSSPGDLNAKLSLNLNFSSLFSGDENLANASLKTLSPEMLVSNSEREVNDSEILFSSETFSGTLEIFDATGDRVYNYPITASLDSSWNGNVQQNFVVKPNNYTFKIWLQKGNHRYYGELNTPTSVVEATSLTPLTTVDLDISPMIGATDITTVVTEIPKFRFNYLSSNFSAFSNPNLDVTISGDTQNLILIDGSSDVYVNLSGDTDVELLLKDGTTNVARANYTGENSINFVPGITATMNLVPIYGRIGIDLIESGGDAIFNFVIPADVVVEVGGAANLQTTFTLYEPKKDSTTDVVLDQVTEIVGGSGDYETTTTISEVQYDTLTLGLTFEDIASNDEIGSCSFEVTIDASADTNIGDCNIDLIRRAEITGDILSLVDVWVVDATGDSVNGADIYIDGSGSSIGVTADADGGYSGYLGTYLGSGTHSFRAVSGPKEGEVTGVVIDQWGVGYVLIQLTNE